ncbi:MAG: VacJ family lipoprotein [Methylococcales bacterium]
MNTPLTGINTGLLLSSILISGLLNGCAGTQTTESADPWVSWNKGAQSFNDDVDDVILKPMAKGYLWMTSDAVDEGVTNFFSNINDIGVTVNDLLQFKLTQSGMDASRFLINTTAGMVGVFDVAKKINLPKHHEDFGQTLGFWGIPSGPYLVLPFFGASSPRDAVGLVGDALLDPLTYTFLLSGGLVNAASIASSAVDVTDTRAGLMMTEKLVNEASVDKYDFIKNAYQQRREYLVHDGNPPESDDPMLEADGVLDSSPATSDGNINNGNNTNSGVPVTQGNTTITNPTKPGELPPVINRSKHMLDLTAPE